MKETGIIMSGDHPKLILDDLKTMTRRVIKDPRRDSRESRALLSASLGKPCIGDIQAELKMNLKPNFPCPYGQVGDQLWVRETTWRGQPIAKPIYDADLTDSERADYWDEGWRKRPSIFMPRWASRITLEITGVRAERLQEISIADAIAEGCSLDFDMEHFGNYKDPKSKFQELWDSLNAKRGYGWEFNPWVWVISFKRI